MAKAEWGAKRQCASCGERFYDLNRDPITCPDCGALFELEALTRGKRVRAVARAEAVEKVIEADDAELVDDEDIEEDDAVLAAADDDEGDDVAAAVVDDDDGLDADDDVLLEDDEDDVADELGDIVEEEPVDDLNRRFAPCAGARPPVDHAPPQRRNSPGP